MATQLRNRLTRRPASGVQNQYTQIYGPLGKGDNYTSPLLHTILLTGLSPKTRYYYQCALPGCCDCSRACICATPCVARDLRALKLHSWPCLIVTVNMPLL